MTGPIALRAEGVGLRRSGRTILDGIDLVVPAGRAAALVGPSGSGKTTLLTALAAFQPIDRGTVTYDGRSVTPAGRDPWTGRVQLVHQAFGLLSLLTAAENVELALQGLPGERRPRRRAVRAAALEALGSVGLTARADNLVEELSGGEQQRVALARALVTGPDLLLADEPTAQLDPANRERVTDLLLGLTARGVTVVLATHDQELSARCDPVLALRDGVLDRAR
ncbi:ABC transporter ATP-binding protein [Amnibacterium endophyticum]|uniref:ABC transporter ATP-binding protein n=1 Tax=Amnibacterium endophyticum TaxID=2109337 RepID=A0ABW4L9X7_9MICO